MKRFLNLMAAAMVCAALGLSASFAEEKTEAPAKHEKEAHVYSPYSKLTLTDDQKKQIGVIQADARAKIKAIEADEETKVNALLTEDQKKELAAMEEKAKEHQKEAAKERYAKIKEEKDKEKAAAKATGKASAPAPEPEKK